MQYHMRVATGGGEEEIVRMNMGVSGCEGWGSGREGV